VQCQQSLLLALHPSTILSVIGLVAAAGTFATQVLLLLQRPHPSTNNRPNRGTSHHHRGWSRVDHGPVRDI